MLERSLPMRLRDAARAVPLVVRDPELLGRWLLTARRAQLALILTLFVGGFLWPAPRDAFVEAVFPPSSERAGLFSRRRRAEHPSAALARTALDGLFWAGGLGGSAALLLLQLPVVLAGRRRGGDPAPEGGGYMGTDATLLPGAAPGMRGIGTDATLLPGAAPGMGGMGTDATLLPGTTSGAPGADGAFAARPAGSAPGGRYRIEAEIGRGGMGVVYRAHDPILDRIVALKELPAQLIGAPDLAERFRTEARVLARLTHTGIVQVFDFVEDGQGLWMALELVTGGSLDDLLEARGPLGVDETLSLGVAMAEGLAYAHEQGVVHRDFKPGNVLLTPEGRPKITDFGLAKLAQGPKLTQVGAVLGSPAYMSPEQASGREADARSDMYSFGVTLYQMSTGRLPFEGDTTSVLVSHITQAPPSPLEHSDELPPALSSLILTLLEKEPAARLPDMAGVAAALREVAS